MHRLGLVVACALMWTSAAGAEGPADSLACRLVPVPVQIEVGPGAGLRLTEGVRIGLPPAASDQDRFAAEELRDEIRQTLGLSAVVAADARAGASIVLGRRGSTPEGPVASLGYKPEVIRSAQGYFLAVTPEQVVVYGHSEPGLYYGVQTLRQLLRLGNPLPVVRIHDWPSLEYRGIQDDISRGPVPTVDLWKRIIRTAAHFKMNLFCFYIEHVFQFRKYPFIGPEGGSLTPEQVRELVAYARPMHVDILPQFQCFAHQYHVLKHPQLAHVREHPDSPGVFSPAVPETYQVLNDLWSELLPPFESPFFHMGCDETYGLDQGRSKELSARLGVARVYVQHIQRLCEMLKPYRRTPMFWGDIALSHPEMIPHLPKELIFMNWTYSPDASFEARVRQVAEAGLKQFVCPGVSCWSQIWPQMRVAVTNIGNFVRDGAKYGVMGMLNTTWDDDGENFWSPNWYGMIYSAGVSWNAARRETACFDQGLGRQFFGPAGEQVVRIIWTLDQCNAEVAGQMSSDQLFWDPPLGGGGSRLFPRFAQRMQALREQAAQAIEMVRQARGQTTRNADALDYMEFAGRRFAFLAAKYLEAAAAARDYRLAYDASADRAAAGEAIRRAAGRFAALAQELDALKARYAQLWLQENRPYYLDQILPRYEKLGRHLRDWQARLLKLEENVQKGQALPLPEDLHMAAESPEPGRSVVRYILQRPAGVSPWAVPDCRYRVAVELQSPVDRPGPVPVQVAVDLRALAGGDLAGRIDTRSWRLMAESAAPDQAQARVCQYEPAAEGDVRFRGTLVWLEPGSVDAQTPRRYGLYFNLQGIPAGAAPESPLRLQQEPKTGDWVVDTGAIRVRLARQGSALVEWRVKALDDRDVTDPGLTDWHGFAETGDPYRGQTWKLDVPAQGPVRVVLRATADDGFVKRYIFYAGQPWCEVRLNVLRQFIWNYDHPQLMAADSPTPGVYLFEAGQTGPVPASSCSYDQRPSFICRWACKYRPDGLTLGMVLPDGPSRLTVGPGGGLGGVGLEYHQPVDRFVVFCARAEDPKTVLSHLREALASARPMQVTFFPVEEAR